MCEIINIGDSTAIICRGNHEAVNHKCDENAVVYTTALNGRLFFNNNNEADKWYAENYEYVTSCSVACSYCGKAAIDDAFYF